MVALKERTKVSINFDKSKPLSKKKLWIKLGISALYRGRYGLVHVKMVFCRIAEMDLVFKIFLSCNQSGLGEALVEA